MEIVNGRECNKCGVFKESGEFNLNGRMPDGTLRLRAICKACGSRHKLVETAPEKKCADCGKVKPTAEFSENGIHPYCRPCSNERTYMYKRGEGRIAHNARMSEYVKIKWSLDPEYRAKTAARHAVHRAIKNGLQRPDSCQRCGRKCKVQAHHHAGYDKANWLNVEWLCPRCHRQEEAH